MIRRNNALKAVKKFETYERQNLNNDDTKHIEKYWKKNTASKEYAGTRASDIAKTIYKDADDEAKRIRQYWDNTVQTKTTDPRRLAEDMYKKSNNPDDKYLVDLYSRLPDARFSSSRRFW